MSDENDGQEQNSTPPPQGTAPTLDEVLADRDRWKALSRQNESNYNATRTELQQLKEAQEQALETARADGRTAVLSEVSNELVSAELRLQATAAGKELPDPTYLDMTRFKGDDHRPNAEVIKSFVDSLSSPGSSAPKLPKIGGAFPNRGGSSKFSSTDPNELADYISGGSFL
ncbi:hypothetical protein AB0J38_41220 [Streptomyces sp. NPDC050095]|uniref:hypothetical protein n=1 Tax=unclassified Streptomyces TaxID=2593676 RepID=UPI00343527E4